MSRRPRRNHTPGFKAKVALAAIKGDRTLAQLTALAQRYARMRSSTLRTKHMKRREFITLLGGAAGPSALFLGGVAHARS